VLDRIEAELSGLDMTIPSDIAKYNFLKASKISCEAAIAFSLRYADLAEEMLKTETDPRRKEELLTISKMCRKVPEFGAESFYELCSLFGWCLCCFN
jgi:formate C-acetyltransferase